MERILVSKNGPFLSRIIAGTWKWGVWGHQLSISEQASLIQECVSLGITSFDHADIYGDHTTEEEFGKALKELQIDRASIELVTKCGIKMPSDRRAYPLKTYDTSAEHIMWSVENSLQAFQSDYIDLLLIHRPSPLMDPSEIAGTFKQLRAQGKVLHFGVSNFTPSQFQMLDAKFELATNQIEASLLHLQPFRDGTLDQAVKLDRKPMIWSPFGSGKLFDPMQSAQVHRIAEVAGSMITKYGVERLDQIYLAWLMRHPANPLPLLGTARADRLKSAVDALSVQLSREDWFALWTAATGEDVP